MPKIGNIEPFDSKTSWQTYKTRLTAWFAINEIADESKVNTLIALIGSESVDLLTSLCYPTVITGKSYNELIQLLDKHHNEGQNEVIEAYKFNSRLQTEKESVAEYIIEVKKLALYCNFGNYLQSALRNRLVSGVRNEAIRSKLLSEGSDLTWEKASETALAMDTAQTTATQLMKNAESGTTTMTSDVHQVQGNTRTYTKRYNSRRADGQNKPCSRCGKNNHSSVECRFREAKCHGCGKTGHIKTVCRSMKSSAARYTEVDTEETVMEEEPAPAYVVTPAREKKASTTPPIYIDVLINDIPLSMELDTACSYSLIPLTLYNSKFSDIPMYSSNRSFIGFAGAVLRCQGKIKVNVTHGGHCSQQHLHIVPGAKCVLLGRDWLYSGVKIDWSAVATLCGDASRRVSGVTPELDEIVGQFPSVFQAGLGTLEGSEAHLELTEGAVPRTAKPYRLPFALRDKVDKELTRLEQAGVIIPVETSKWSTPIVAVPKPDGSIRVCGNYKATLNPLLRDHAPPNINLEEILASLAGSKYFTKLDLASAYNQMRVDPESRELLTLATHKGLYTYTRLVFGIKTAPAIWQRAMEQVLQGIPGVRTYYDDILVTGCSLPEHMHTLKLVLSRLQDRGLRLNKSKCSFLGTSVEYLGHVIDELGVRPLPHKLEAVLDTAAPVNKDKLRSYLGLLSYYRKFLPNLASEIQPLTDLMRDNRQFSWGNDAAEAFDRSKQLLRGSDLLIHFDPQLPLVLTCDASRHGVAAVLSHVCRDGKERPIQFASQKLTEAQIKYPQIEREALAIMYGLDKFYYFLYGRKFKLVTDNKPLSIIFGPHKGMPVMSAERLQRWAFRLLCFDYEVECRRSKENNADFLSRYPQNTSRTYAVDEGTHIAEEHAFAFKLGELPIQSVEVARVTRRDPVLSQVLAYTLEGWPHRWNSDLDLFYHKRYELSVMSGVLLWGCRVIVPSRMHRQVLDMLHLGHIGMSKMKMIARSFVWWSGIDKDIENTCRVCISCQLHSNNPSTEPVHSWLQPTRPMQRVHIDYAEKDGQMMLVIVDSYSKFPEVICTRSTTSTQTVNILLSYISRYGIMEELVSDNGPQFVSVEFKEFTSSLGITHKTPAPYHPASNGLAERFVQTVKNAIRAEGSTVTDMQNTINKFLLAYRSAPHAVTGVSPAELFLGRTVRTLMNALRPQCAVKSSNNQSTGGIGRRKLELGQQVWVRNYLGKDKWMPGTVIDIHGPMLYSVQVGQGRTWRRHIEQLKVSVQGEELEMGEKQRTDETLSGQSLDSPTVMVPPHVISFVPQVPQGGVIGGQQASQQTTTDLPKTDDNKEKGSMGVGENMSGTENSAPSPGPLITATPKRSQRKRNAPIRFSP